MSAIGNTTPTYVSKAEQAVISANKAMGVAVGAELGTAPVKLSGKAHKFADSIEKLVVKDGIASIGTGLSRVDITMPVAQGSPAQVVDEMIVYSERDLSFMVQSTEEGIRMLSVLESPTADHSVNYTLNLPEGIVPKLRDDGGVYLAALASSRVVDGPTVYIAELEPPWAVDANGQAVPTHYVIQGNTLTQVISPGADAAYPITADPSYKACRVASIYPGICADYRPRSAAVDVANLVINSGSAQNLSAMVCGAGGLLGIGGPIGAAAGVAVVAYCEAGVFAAFTRARIDARTVIDGGPSKCLRLRGTTVLIPPGLFSPVVPIRC
jgi:hypothetical protein